MEDKSERDLDLWPKSSSESPGVTAVLLGLIGAAAGGALGYLVFGWILSQGFYAMIIPGAALGLGFALAARCHRAGYGVICAVLALGLGLFTEWKHFPFVADESFTYFLTHLQQLKPMTWIMIGLGCVFAFSFGQGRRR